MNRNSCLMTAVMLALQAFALPVAAEVVLFDNTDGTFQWLPAITGFPINYFDPTQPPTQSGLETMNSLLYSPVTQATSKSFSDGEFIGLGEIKIAVGDLIGFGTSTGTRFFLPPQQFRAGAEIGADADWRERAVHSFKPYRLGDFITNLLDPQPTIGFRTGSNELYHYGWIELGVRELPDPYNSPSYPYQPLRWAYETELNTPITVPITVIPEPASVCVLVLSAVAAVCLPSVRRAVRR